MSSGAKPRIGRVLQFSDFELKVMEDYAELENLEQPIDLGSAMLAMAIMGGYLNRKNDRPPGYKLIWGRILPN